MTITSDIYLRALEPEDATLIFMWENDSNLWQYGNAQAPLSLHQIRQYIDNYTDDVFANRQLRLMICHGDMAVGTIDLYELDPIHRRAGVGIMVAQEHQHEGIAKLALEAFARYAEDRLGLHQLWCVCAVNNIPAIATFKSAGFTISSKLRSWIRIGHSYTDAFILQKLLTRAF